MLSVGTAQFELQEEIVCTICPQAVGEMHFWLVRVGGFSLCSQMLPWHGVRPMPAPACYT